MKISLKISCPSLRHSPHPQSHSDSWKTLKIETYCKLPCQANWKHPELIYTSMMASVISLFVWLQAMHFWHACGHVSLFIYLDMCLLHSLSRLAKSRLVSINHLRIHFCDKSYFLLDFKWFHEVQNICSWKNLESKKATTFNFNPLSLQGTCKNRLLKVVLYYFVHPIS